MADIKRPNYFTSQFLVEKDFDDEQAYHLTSRRRHNRVLHTSGVADGLDVTLVSGRQVLVGAGTAIDREGREIVLPDSRAYTLTTVDPGIDVYLTIAYRDVLDAADQDTQGLGEFTRTTERPLLEDSAAVPPADAAVVVLARIRLNGAGVIESNAVIDTSVRAIGGARVAPSAIDTARLADGAVTLAKLASEVQPHRVAGANAITVDTDNTRKQITVGETHSARTDNPHGTTAAQVDTHGGANQLVAQINAGAGVIGRSRVETRVVSGVVTFQNLAAGIELFSEDIDPGFGPGPVTVELAIDDAPAAGFTFKGRPTSGEPHAVFFRSQVNRATGRFRIFVTRNAGSPTGPAAVRWSAFKPAVGPNANVAVGVTVAPTAASVIGNATQVFNATVQSTTQGAVTWRVSEPGGGTVTPLSASSARYTPPGVSGTYHVVATSTADPTRSATAAVTVNADITVTLSRATATVFGGATLSNLTATVINTDNTGVTWSIQEGASGGSLSATAGASVNYTAPPSAGTYHVTATSNANPSRSATCTITVPAVTIALATTTATVFRGESRALAATVANANNTGVTWSIQEGAAGGSLTSTTGATTNYTAPLAAGTYHVIATSNADPTKQATCTITVPVVTISIAADASTVTAGGSTGVRATITGTSNPNANWVSQSGVASVSPATGPATTWFAPNVGGSFTVLATAIADTSRTATVTITVPNVGGDEGGGGGGKVIDENIVLNQATIADTASPAPDEPADTSPKARAFVSPKKRLTTRRPLPPDPGGE